MANSTGTGSIQAVKSAPELNAGAVGSKPAPYFQWIQIASIILLLALLYWQVVSDMAVDWWNDEGASHGLLIPPLALYLAWARRGSVLGEPASYSLKGLWITAFGCIMFLIGRLGAEFFLTRISLVIILTGLIWT